MVTNRSAANFNFSTRWRWRRDGNSTTISDVSKTSLSRCDTTATNMKVRVSPKKSSPGKGHDLERILGNEEDTGPSADTEISRESSFTGQGSHFIYRWCYCVGKGEGHRCNSCWFLLSSRLSSCSDSELPSSLLFSFSSHSLHLLAVATTEWWSSSPAMQPLYENFIRNIFQIFLAINVNY